MLELIAIDAAIIGCHADQAQLDRFAAPDGAVSVRIARDELWLIGQLSDRDQLAEQAERLLADTDALVVDQSDGWTTWGLRGDHRPVLHRLMLAPLPDERPAFVQGAITGVPGKVVATADTVHLMVPSPVGHHLRDRIIGVCRDLAPSVVGPEQFPARGR